MDIHEPEETKCSIAHFPTKLPFIGAED